MSRLPKPAGAKKRLGNPGKRPIPAPLVVIPAANGVPTPPSDLRAPGRAAWRRLWRHAGAWLSPTTDIAALARLCRLYDEESELHKVIADEGRFTTGSTGQTVAHPAVPMLRAVEAAAVKLESLLGLTPVDRSHLGLAVISAAEKQSKLDEFMARARRRDA